MLVADRSASNKVFPHLLSLHVSMITRLEETGHVVMEERRPCRVEGLATSEVALERLSWIAMETS